ncbi:cytochrome P450 [Methylocella tundrae]|uniref:Putative 4-methoxybenzoate monooxygenase (O-demethylating) n=1 Tax=Methylocella tundrae TaxID=227605 RepID=A0A4U8Z7Z8_METTU|nr:cytochrome P450 [Methylocella tundrae]WPP02932.1 cytochrome P450 [Methylocella tundrae]VFU16592.1 putative 4-methoxybenzoate monooxygenase (O-demethylating) [Methylocella tundrae]
MTKGVATYIASDPHPGVPRLDVDPFSEAFLADPYSHHENLRAAGPVFWLEPYRIYGSARHAEVSAALKDYETFCSARGVGLADFAREEPWRSKSLLLEADPPLHTRTRGMMNKVVTLAALMKELPLWQEKADQLVDELLQRRSFDAVTDLAEVYPMRVFPDLIGLPPEGRDNLVPYGTATFNAFGPRNALFEETMRDAKDAMLWVASSCKRENLADEAWGAKVYRTAEAEDCSPAEAELLVRSFLTAGLDTTINGIAHLMLALASHPDQWRKLQANPSVLVKNAFEESLRWDSTVQTFFRTTTREVEFGGAVIPKDAKIILFLGAANRDPRRWNDPESFDVERQAAGHVGFGFGIHQCLGQMIARREAEAVLKALVSRVADIRITGATSRRLNNTLHALSHLPVEITALP